MSLESRAVVDQARAMVMVLAPCSCEQAWGLLVDVSQHCNVKLRDVAEAWVATALSVISQPRKTSSAAKGRSYLNFSVDATSGGGLSGRTALP
ncbi:ANTAR domain-containing protein [Streptomyces canus]|uniref:ANTAR domain-containing protein n=1 Tax=Streptomyces canus TaxID=58343 RepID=UPI0027D7D6B0|nr:ANTAR domain-containing protein [Streptomyces canus]